MNIDNVGLCLCVAVTSSCSGSGVGRRLGVGAKSAAYLASIESLEDSDEGKRPLALQRLKGSSTSQGQLNFSQHNSQSVYIYSLPIIYNNSFWYKNHWSLIILILIIYNYNREITFLCWLCVYIQVRKSSKHFILSNCVLLETEWNLYSWFQTRLHKETD